jgi:uncharacterized protein (TIGR01244 family)
MKMKARTHWGGRCDQLRVVVAALLLMAGAARGDDTDFSAQIAQVSDHVVIAGAVDLDKLRASHAGDVLVVDLRTEGEGAPAEAEAARALGLGYANIPVSSVNVDPAQVDALRGLLDGAGPDTLVVVHCASGNRASMLWGAAALSEGQSLDSVRASVEGVLTKQPAIDGLEAFARSIDVEP